MKQKVYLDVCTLCRSFDNQSYLRIRLETEAVNLIISKIRSKQFRLMVSPVHYREISDISEAKERIELEAMLKNLGLIETARFINLPRPKRLESLKRHRQWQKNLYKDKFLKEIFG